MAQRLCSHGAQALLRKHTINSSITAAWRNESRKSIELDGENVVLENGQRRIYWYVNRGMNNMGKGRLWKGIKRYQDPKLGTSSGHLRVRGPMGRKWSEQGQERFQTKLKNRQETYIVKSSRPVLSYKNFCNNGNILYLCCQYSSN